jgi:hypothetical protein
MPFFFGYKRSHPTQSLERAQMGSQNWVRNQKRTGMRTGMSRVPMLIPAQTWVELLETRSTTE